MYNSLGTYLIIESPIIQEASLVRDYPERRKAYFRAVLQTANEINQNRRLYPKHVLEQALGRVRDRISNRSFFCELDHPLIYGNDTRDEIRQATVLLAESSHIITNYQFDGNVIVGEAETLNTPKGLILYNLLAKDRTTVGVSMRGMAELLDKQDYHEVCAPLLLISYDSVSNPSHEKSLISPVRFESLSLTGSALTESLGSSKEGLICVDGRCYLKSYIQALIEEKRIKFKERWI